jgi:hypothetical protein
MSLTELALEQVARPLRLRRNAAWAVAALGATLLLLGIAAWLARLDVIRTLAWVPAVWVAALLLAAVAVWGQQRAATALATRSVAEWLERSGAWRLGSLRSLFERAQQGSSPELAQAADAASAAAVGARAPEALAPLSHRLAREMRAGAALLGLGAVTLASSGALSGTGAVLWHPLRAWRAVVSPLQLTASADSVDRGAAVTLTATTYGRREATLWLRSPGEAWRETPLTLDANGVATHVVPMLETDLFARVSSGERGSDTVMVHVRQPVFLASLEVTARYPAYLGLEDEPIPTTGDTVLLPAGTRLETRGEATSELENASWVVGEAESALPVNGKQFDGDLTPSRSGAYRLHLRTASGAPLAGDSVVLPLRIVPDSAPALDIPVPGADTTAAPDARALIVIDAHDDHGLKSVVLELRRVSGLGAADPMREQVVALPGGTPDRAVLSAQVSLQQLGLVPGDSLRYRARAVDNSPRSQTGWSREYVLRIQTLTELRAEQRRETSSLQSRLDSLAAQSKKLERQTEDLARSQPRDANKPGDNSDNLSFEQAKKAEAVAESQQELLKQAEEARQALQELQKNAETAGIADSALMARLAEVQQQLEKALTPEIRAKLEELRQALKELDAERTQDALKDLAEKQKELREALERSKELFERAAMEGQLESLAQDSKELQKDQAEWNKQVTTADSQRAAAAEQQLATKAETLSSELKQLSEQMKDTPRGDKLEQASQQAGKAAQKMQQASKSAKSGQKQKAKSEGEEAEKELAPLGDDLQEEREQMAQDWRDEVLQQLDQALADVSRLGEKQLAVSEGFERGDPAARLRSDQGALEEGVQRLQEQVRQAAGKNALISPEIGTSLAAASRFMQQARDAVSSANANPREAGDRAGDALDALNAAAHGLLRARGDVSGSESGSGLAEAMEKMGQLAKQQGQLGEQGASLIPQMGAGGGAQQQLQQLAAQQRALAQELEKLRGQGKMPGAGEMASEAEELAQRLQAGRLDRQTVERQEKLFRRMLDAGRTLQGEQEDEQKERQSTTANNDSVLLPPALRARLQDEDGRLQVPSWEDLQRLSPAERRIVVDYFRRLATPGAP